MCEEGPREDEQLGVGPPIEDSGGALGGAELRLEGGTTETLKSFSSEIQRTPNS